MLYGIRDIRPMFPLERRVTVVCGHYGTGKTNLSINLALECARQGEDVTLVDLDVVNPYFRSADYADILTRSGVKVVGPNFANTNLDTPSLPAAAVTRRPDGKPPCCQRTGAAARQFAAAFRERMRIFV